MLGEPFQSLIKVFLCSSPEAGQFAPPQAESCAGCRYKVELFILYDRAYCLAAIATVCCFLELRKTDLMPSNAEITAMEVFLEVMKPIVRITEVIGGEQRVTLSAAAVTVVHQSCHNKDD